MNATEIDRSATRCARRFEVYFGECNWDDLEELPELAAGSDNVDIVVNVTQTLNLTFRHLTGKNDENSQKGYFVDCINPLLSLFGYIGHIWTDKTNPDLKIQKKGGLETVFIVGEAKKVVNLPHTNLDSALSKALLLFGFSTKIFKEQWAADPDNRQILAGIRSLLKLRKPSKSLSSNDNDIQLSTMAEGLLANQYDNGIPHAPSPLENEMRQSAATVNDALVNDKIGAQDALHLWGATMQCCEVCIVERKKLGIVKSVRVMWYIRLEVDNGKCTLRISNGTYVFRKGFVGKLLRLIRFAETGHNNNLEPNDRASWACSGSHPTIQTENIRTDEDDSDEDDSDEDGDGSENGKNGNNETKRRHSRQHPNRGKRKQNVFRVLNTEEKFPVPVTSAQCSKQNASNQPPENNTASKAP
eukprot:scaffold421149_cov81-Attheya_sp.AAC.1